MKLDKNSIRLYLVTDRSWLNGKRLTEQVEEAVIAGVTFIQLREKELSFEDFVKEAKELKAVMDKYKIPFVINDNLEVALAINADGVHIGQEDEGLMKARKLLGNDKIIGVSAHTVSEAQKAQREGADYIGVGAVFRTATKSDAKSVSNETLRQMSDAVDIPIVAIGGITEDNIDELAGCGADGVAVVSAILSKEDIGEATRKLRVRSNQLFGTEVIQ